MIELLKHWAPPLTLSLIPGLFWMWFIHSHRPDRSSRVAIAPLTLGFLGGAASVFLVLAISIPLHRYLPSIDLLQRLSWGRFVYFVLIVGLVEEFSKLVAVRVLVYPLKSFREPWDGLLASSAAALGFATAENAKYILDYGDTTVLLARSVSATIGHVLMSGIWGYALAEAKQSQLGIHKGKRPSILVLPALLISAVGHGAYDFLLIQQLGPLALLVLALLWSVFWTNIKESRVLSSKHQVLLNKVKECPTCRSLVRGDYRFCSQCRQPFEQDSSKLCCPSCLTSVAFETEDCPDCQRQFVTLPAPAPAESRSSSEVGESLTRESSRL
jgi:protease PrsW